MDMEIEKKPRDPFRRQRIVTVLTAVTVLLGSLLAAKRLMPLAEPAMERAPSRALILDPGHGGIDGGAVAYNGVKESDLNLEIALRLRDLAALYGIPTVMTREDDSSADQEHYSERENLALRVERINATAGGVLFSIHQNTFPTSQPFGAQVLYGPGAESRRLGETLQRILVETLQPENRRVAGPAPQKLYITARATCPSVLVECGFLSNLSDLQRLCDEHYQRKLAAVMLCAYLEYTAQTA
jgi:N-acetylmuramoyl-L-alanine amidase